MNAWKLIRRGLAFYWRTHLAVLLGTAVGTAILVGALVAGDSMRYSLRELAVERLGRTEIAITADERFFRSRLADDLARSGGLDAAPVLLARGIAKNTERELLANAVNVIGVDERFWIVGAAADAIPRLERDTALINDHLAARLDVQDGDEVLLRIERPDLMPWEMPFSARGSSGPFESRGSGASREPGTSPTLAVRVRIEKTLTDESFGRFSLRANQAAPLNVFLSLPWLGKKLGLEERANAILLAGRQGNNLRLASVGSLLRACWRLPDAGLELRNLESGRVTELVSNRVFLDPPVVDAAFGAGENPKGILSYFVNEIRLGTKATPYSFVAAPGEPLIPAGTPDDGIVINEWLAEDLGASTGDVIGLSYYVPGPGGALEEKHFDFRVLKVTPIEGPAADAALMPNFPGLAGVESCSDWRPGVPIDLTKIRRKDEQYWSAFKGTPKAFVTLGAARAMWKNRFGDLTAVRYAGRGEKQERIEGEIANEILRNLDPASVGMKVLPVRETGLRAGSGAVDFGQLFLGLSLFLIASSLMITSLLFAFNIAHRAEDIGVLLSLGFEPSLVARILTIEGACVALGGSMAGALIGLLYNKAILHGLNTVWRDAVGFSSLKVFLKAPTIAAGAVIGAAIALITMWLAARKQCRSLSVTLRGKDAGFNKSGKVPPRRRRRTAIIGYCAIGLSLALVAWGVLKEKGATGLFFPAGALLLAGGLTCCYALILKVRDSPTGTGMTIAGLSVRGIAREPKRSLAAAGILACGIFIVFAVSANRGFETRSAQKRESGTGGFAFFAETTVPIYADLNDANTNRRHGLGGLGGLGDEDVRFVQMRVREGEDASCLNLNRVQNPRILGVKPEELAGRGSFSFVKFSRLKTSGIKHAERTAGVSPWLLLNDHENADTVPAIADQTVMTWSLHKSVGDTITYTDERGGELKLLFVGALKDSIFQGSVIISEDAFTHRFPSTSGSRAFLVDAPPGKMEAVSQSLLRAFGDFGIELTPAVWRLQEFTKVQNTYLSIYLLLGGLGLILGSFGSGLVVMRNVLERRGELAILRAVGFTRRMVWGVLYLEHVFMIAAGILCGAASALVAVVPVLLAQGTGLPNAFLSFVLAAVAAVNFGWTFIAAALATRGEVLPALRQE